MIDNQQAKSGKDSTFHQAVQPQSEEILRIRYAAEFEPYNHTDIFHQELARLSEARARHDTTQAIEMAIRILRKIEVVNEEQAIMSIQAGLIDNMLVIIDKLPSSRYEFELSMAVGYLCELCCFFLKSESIYEIFGISSLLSFCQSPCQAGIASGFSHLIKDYFGDCEHKEILKDFNKKADERSNLTHELLYENDFVRGFGHCGFHKHILEIDNSQYNHGSRYTISIGTHNSLRRSLISNKPFLLKNMENWVHADTEKQISTTYLRNWPYVRSCYFSRTMSERNDTSNRTCPNQTSLSLLTTWNMGAIAQTCRSPSVPKVQVSNKKSVILHFRGLDYYGEKPNSPASYRCSTSKQSHDAIRYLHDSGFKLISFSHPRMYAKSIRRLMEYELGIDDQSKDLQYQRLSECNFMLCCASGPACTGSPLGIPMVAINWWPVLQYPYLESDIVCVKHILHIPTNQLITPRQYQELTSLTGDPFTPLPGYRQLPSTKYEILEAVKNVNNSSYAGGDSSLMGYGFNGKITLATFEMYKRI
jgi:putative glycosyltransferase (TIGR04372 family)